MLWGSKKGGEKIFSIWWLFVLGIVGVGIVGGVMVFYSSEIDVREIESDVMFNRISECLIDNGFLIEEVLTERFDIFGFCDLDSEVFGKGSSFYFNVSVFGDGKLLRKNILGGDFSFEKDCLVAEDVVAENYPKCKIVVLPVLYYESGVKSGEMKVMTASNNKLGGLNE